MLAGTSGRALTRKDSGCFTPKLTRASSGLKASRSYSALVRAHSSTQFWEYDDLHWGAQVSRTAGDGSNYEAADTVSPGVTDSWEFYGDGASLPWPSNLPTNQEQDESRYPLMYYPTAQRSNFLEEANLPALRKLPDENGSIYVILFGVGEEATEGIYTLRTQDYIDGSLINVDTVVAFESADDAERFATLLEASLTHVPTVCPMTWGEITGWCDENNTRCRLESSGSLLLPPDSNVNVTDWERTLRLQRGEFRVLDLEPTSAAAAAFEGLSSQFFIDDWVSSSIDDDATEVEEELMHNAVDSQVAVLGLDAIRENLERKMMQ